MATKRHNIIVITVSAIIAISILLVPSAIAKKSHYEIRVYRVTNGWGYDILAEQKLLIRQESIPVIQTNRSFPGKEQAERTAQLVVNKLESHLHPALTKSEIEKILSLNDVKNGR